MRQANSVLVDVTTMFLYLSHLISKYEIWLWIMHPKNKLCKYFGQKWQKYHEVGL